MSAAVIVANPLGAQITALSAELVARRDELAAAVDLVQVRDPASLIQAEALFKSLDQFTKQVNADRLTLTRQLDAVKRQIMDAEEAATAPLLQRRQRLAKTCADFREKLEDERREAERKAREEAERIAAEQRREQEEARKRQLAEWQAAEDAKRKEAEEEAALFGTTPAAVVAAPPPPPAAPAPVVAVVIPQTTAPVLPKSTVRKTVRRRTVIFDRPALIAAACKDGGKLYGRQVLLIDEAAVDALMKAAVEVPGARSEEYETVGAAGSR